MTEPVLPELIRLQETMRATLDRAARDAGIATSEYLVLGALAGDERLSGAQLARVARVTPQSMHGVLLRLQRGGLIEPHPHPTDGRLRVYALTPAGAAAAAEAEARAAEVEERLMRGMDENASSALVGSIRECVSALERLRPRPDE